jgi:hypothetical protein
MPLFDRKSRARGRAGEPVAAMRFEARCPAGHEITGQRTESFQAVRCPECGDGIFIGPTSWLPVPPAASRFELIPLGSIRDVSASAKSGPASPGQVEAIDGDSDDTIDAIPLKGADRYSDDPGQGLPVNDPAANFDVVPTRDIADGDFQKLIDKDADRRATEARDRQKQDQKRNSEEKPRHAPGPESEDDSGEFEIEAAPRIPLHRRIGTRVWVILGVILIIGLTIRVQIRQNYRDRIPEIVKKARTDGLTSLDAGHFDEAKQILTEGSEAFDYLRDDSDDAQAVRQAAKEASILADLVGRPLDEIIDRFAAGEAGKADFRTLEKGRSIVVEARVTGTPDMGEGYDLDFRVPVGPGPTPARPLGKLDVKNLELLTNLKPNLGETVLIGVRLSDLELIDGVWSIRLDPKSGVLMTRWAALQAIGWPVTDRAGDVSEDDKR